MDKYYYTIPNFNNDYHLMQYVVEAFMCKYPPAVYNIEINITNQLIQIIVYVPNEEED